MSAFNFKNDITFDNSKSIRWVNNTNTTKHSVITLGTDNSVSLLSPNALYLNNGTGATFINTPGIGSVFIGSKLGVSTQTISTLNADLALKTNGYIGSVSNGNSGYIGLSGTDTLTTSGARIILYGTNATGGNDGSLKIYGGNSTGGSVSINVSGSGSGVRALQVASSGTTLFSPDGATNVCSIQHSNTLFTNIVNISNTTQSVNASTGALQVSGGISVFGNSLIHGMLSIDALNYAGTSPSINSTTGALVVNGGISISSTENSTSITCGNGITVAGGIAVAKDAYIGGNIYAKSTSASIDSFSGSFVSYGGCGLNGNLNIRSTSSQLHISPITSNQETSIKFHYDNAFGADAWVVGNNVIGSSYFGICNQSSGIFLASNGNIGINTAPSTYTMDVLGNVHMSNDLTVDGLLSSISDIRLKENITNIPVGVLDKLLHLTPIKYNLKNSKTTKTQIGLIAQEIINAGFPELVSTSQDGLYSLDYSRITVLLIASIKELYKLVKNIDKVNTKIDINKKMN